MDEKKLMESLNTGTAGETHQIATSKESTMTTAQGCPVSDNQNSLKASARGPTLMEDHIMREKIFHFDHERIPERVVHARGCAAHGYFECTKAIPELTKACLFQTVGEQTEVFVRFSTVAGSKGSPDLARDVRGFATKFYTKEGNWDLVGNNIPVFFIQDAIKFPDLIHSAKEEPHSGFPQAATAHDNFWDFISLTPESMHMVMWAMSDRGIPRSLRFMEGFGVHTFRFINHENKPTFVKFHWKPKLGVQSVVWNEAVKINGADLDFHRRDLFDAIEAGQFPEWELGVQVLDEAFLQQYPFDVLDPTKLVPEEDCPVQIIGRMVLNKNVENFFAETEQVAFCTQNIVPGIDFSEDPLLQGRNFSYLDTQLKRLGSPNFTHIPVNAPRCPVMHFQQDGHMTLKNPIGRVNYEPNSWGPAGGPRENPERGFRSAESTYPGGKVRVRSETFSDHYSQARQFYLSQTPLEQKHIADAIVFETSKVQKKEIRVRVLSHLLNIDQSLAQQVAEGLGIASLPPAANGSKPLELKVSPKLSIIGNENKSGFKTRKLGVIVSTGADADLIKTVLAASKKKESFVELISSSVTGIKDSKGNEIDVSHQIGGAPSVLFDAIAIITTEEAAKQMCNNPAVRDFLSDAIAHNKFVAYNSPSLQIFEASGLTNLMDEGCFDFAQIKADKFLDHCDALRFWQREQSNLN